MRDCAGAKGADLNFSLLQAIPQGKCHLNSSIHMDLPFGDSREVKQVKKPNRNFHIGGSSARLLCLLVAVFPRPLFSS